MKHLLPEVSKYFKTNLHTHSTISDGKLMPEEVVAGYKAEGYQVLALTDHNIVVDHSQFTDSDFLMLTGFEVNINHPDFRKGFDGRTIHLCFIAKDPGNLWLPGKLHRWFPVAPENESKIQYDNMELRYSTESINDLIAKANEKGFLVMYNHPTWSCQSYPDYAPLKGLWGMELRNTECLMLGIEENNRRVWKDMINLGNKIYPVGTDDMHATRALGQSWIMVGAEELRYDCVIKALEKGDFYMSCGPAIHSLTIDGNVLKITCSDAQRIALECHGRFGRCKCAEDGRLLQEAEFDLTPFFEKANADVPMYIHLTVTAPDGTYAATRAYWLEELCD